MTGETEAVGDIGFDVTGLAYSPKHKKLYATAHDRYQLIEIDLKTGKGKAVVTLSDKPAKLLNLPLMRMAAYIALLDANVKKHLATCNLDTGKVNLIGEIYFPSLASMKFIGDTSMVWGGSTRDSAVQTVNSSALTFAQELDRL